MNSKTTAIQNMFHKISASLASLRTLVTFAIFPYRATLMDASAHPRPGCACACPPPLTRIHYPRGNNPPHPILQYQQCLANNCRRQCGAWPDDPVGVVWELSGVAKCRGGKCGGGRSHVRVVVIHYFY